MVAADNYATKFRKTLKNERWFDIFRTFRETEIAQTVVKLAMHIWRRQERSDKLQRRKQKRRHFIQRLRAA